MQKTYFWISAGHEHVQWRSYVSFHLHVSSPKLLRGFQKHLLHWGYSTILCVSFIILCPTWNEIQKARCTQFGIASDLVKFWNSLWLLLCLHIQSISKSSLCNNWGKPYSRSMVTWLIFKWESSHSAKVAPYTPSPFWESQQSDI